MPVRISNLTKSFFYPQGRNARRLFRTTSLAGGFLFIQKGPQYKLRSLFAYGTATQSFVQKKVTQPGHFFVNWQMPFPSTWGFLHSEPYKP